MSEAIQKMVVGFCICPEDNNRVLLVQKLKPEWQKGLNNGVGGKVEPDEEPEDAMVREWKEETSWKESPEFSLTAVVTFPNTYIDYPPVELYVFHATAPSKKLKDMQGQRNDAGEMFRLLPLSRVCPETKCIPNLQWMIPLGMDPELRTPIVITAK